MNATSRSLPVPWVTWGKAGASQLIVWHHLVHYGPLAPQVEALAPELVNWLNTRALMAVQVFLVIAGFLAARSLWPQPGAARLTLSEWPQRVWQRYRRLAPPYLAAIVLAILCAALARVLMDDADTPSAPTLPQVLAHVLMLQDIVDLPALSAGVWYVAMDLQLFALMALLAALAGRSTHAPNSMAPPTAQSSTGEGVFSRLARALHMHMPLILLVGAALASLCVFNLDPKGDIWAPYFFGAYALGVLAAWGANKSLPGGRTSATLLIGALLIAGLALEWRLRIALAGVTALVLLWQPGRWALARSRLDPMGHWLAKISYAVFLVHYPVSMAVNALVMEWWPTEVPAHVAGLVASWLLSLACGWLLWRTFEFRGTKRLTNSKHDGTATPAAV